MPTDFSVSSLELVRRATDSFPKHSLEIVLLHGTYCSNSISDLLFFSKTRLLAKLQSQDFVETCNVLRNKYPKRIKKMSVDIITSSNNRYFRNYLEATGIGELIVPNPGFLDFKRVKGINTLSLLGTCGVPCTYVDLEDVLIDEPVQGQQLAGIFFSRPKQ